MKPEKTVRNSDGLFWWTWGESNPRPGNANAVHYHYATGPHLGGNTPFGVFPSEPPFPKLYQRSGMNPDR